MLIMTKKIYNRLFLLIYSYQNIKNMRKLLLLIGLITTSYLLHAQKNVTGTIKDGKTNQPIPGVSVKLKSGKTGTTTNNTGTTTNNNGQFSINASSGDVLEITMIGYKTQSISIADQTQIAIDLEAATTELTEIVFVGNRGVGRAKIETPVPV